MIRQLLPPLTLALVCCGCPVSAQEGNNTGSFFSVSDGREPSVSVLDGAPFYDDKERGWFWYESPDPEEDMAEIEPPLPPPPPAPPPAPPGPKPLSAEWFRKNMEKYRDKAIDDPTHENVSAYMYLQRVMLDKAEKFAEASQHVVMADAVLDENSRRPIATFGAFAKDEMSTKGTEKAARLLLGLKTMSKRGRKPEL